MKKSAGLKKFLSIAFAAVLSVAVIPFSNVSADPYAPTAIKDTTNSVVGSVGVKQVVTATFATGTSGGAITFDGKSLTVGNSTPQAVASEIAALYVDDTTWTASSSDAVLTLTAKQAAANIAVPTYDFGTSGISFTNGGEPKTTTDGKAPVKAKTIYTITAPTADEDMRFTTKLECADGMIQTVTVDILAADTDSNVASKIAAELAPYASSNENKLIFTDQNVNNGEFVLTISPAAFEIKTKPVNQNVVVGNSATFTVAAKGGTGVYTYQWQQLNYPEYIMGNGDWENLPEEKSSTLTLNNISYDMNYYQYRCKVSQGEGSTLTSKEAFLLVSDMSIKTQPLNKTLVSSGTAEFTVEVQKGTTPYVYQWYQSTVEQQATDEWSIVPNAVAATLSVTVTADNSETYNGNKYKCIIKDATKAEIATNAVTLTIKQPLSVKTQIQDVTVAVGSTATFNFEAKGGTAPYNYYWYKIVARSPEILSGENSSHTNTLSLTVTEANLSEFNNVLGYKCKIIDDDGTIIWSEDANFTITQELIVETQPQDVTCTVGDTAEFSVEVGGGTAPYTYKWMYSDGLNGFVNLPVDITDNLPTLSIPLTNDNYEKWNGCKFKCNISDSAASSITSGEATLTVTKKDDPTPAKPPYIAPATNHNPASFPTLGIGDGLSFTAPTSWSKLAKAAKAMADGETLSITTGKSSRIDKSIFKAIMGKDKNLEVICGDSFIWSINGNNITKPRTVNLYAAYANATEDDETEFDGLTTIGLKLSSNRTLGCDAALTISGLEDYEGKTATLYMKKNGYVKVSSGTVENGEVVLDGIKYTTNDAVLVIE